MPQHPHPGRTACTAVAQVGSGQAVHSITTPSARISRQTTSGLAGGRATSIATKPAWLALDAGRAGRRGATAPGSKPRRFKPTVASCSDRHGSPCERAYVANGSPAACAASYVDNA